LNEFAPQIECGRVGSCEPVCSVVMSADGSFRPSSLIGWLARSDPEATYAVLISRPWSCRSDLHRAPVGGPRRRAHFGGKPSQRLTRGPRLATDAGLLDEAIVRVASVSLGRGMPLLPRRVTSPPWQLLSARQVGSGFAELR